MHVEEDGAKLSIEKGLTKSLFISRAEFRSRPCFKSSNIELDQIQKAIDLDLVEDD